MECLSNYLSSSKGDDTAGGGAEQWQRHGREVQPGEEPCKLVRKRGTKAPAALGQPPAFDDDVAVRTCQLASPPADCNLPDS